MDRYPDFFTLRVIAADKDSTETLLWMGLDANGTVIANGSSLPEQLPACSELEIVLPATRVAAQWILQAWSQTLLPLLRAGR